MAVAPGLPKALEGHYISERPFLRKKLRLNNELGKGFGVRWENIFFFRKKLIYQFSKYIIAL